MIVSLTIRAILEDLMGTVEQVEGTVDILNPGNRKLKSQGLLRPSLPHKMLWSKQ